MKEREEFLSTAEALIEKNQYEEALSAAESWIKRYPIDADANIIRCHALLKTGNLEKVNEILEDVENTVLQLARIYNRVGDLCLTGGLTQEAMKFYQKCISLNPASPTAQEISEKINTLSTSDTTATQNNDDTYNNIDDVASDFYTITLAELYITQGHLDMAYDVLGAILKREPENELVANRLNDVEAMQRDRVTKEPSLYVQQNEEVVKELTKWLKNIGRLKSYAL